MSWLRPSFLGFLALVLMAPGAGRAQAYKWVDKDGVVHLTDNPEDLPEPMRSNVLRELEKQQQQRRDAGKPEYPPLPPEARQERLPPAKSSGDDGGAQLDALLKAENEKRQRWKAKAAAARTAVASLEEKCKQLEADRDKSSRDNLLFARPGARQESQKAATDLDDCKRQLEAARHRLEVELPEEARREGVPPGVLSE